MTMERKNAITIKGSPLTLLGEEAVRGGMAKDFKALDNNLQETGLGKFKGKIKLIASVPSLDTPICDLEIKRFNDLEWFKNLRKDPLSDVERRE